MSKIPLISIKNATKKFGDKVIFEELKLEIFSGEVLGVIGPNGGGKSTLLKTLAGLSQPTKGEISTSLKPSTGEIGLVLAKPGFYPLLSAWENLIYFGSLYDLSESEVREKSAPLVERLKLSEMNEALSTLSTGTSQKLSLVRALLTQPKVLLFDEPSANLDPPASEIVFQEMRSQADQGLACVWVTHQLDAAERICDRVVFIDKGIKKDFPVKKDTRLIEVWKKIERANEVKK